MSDDSTTPQPAADQAPWLELALSELRQQRDSLQAEINDLTSRRDQLQQELSGSFAGQSDAIARRVKGFQEYLVGALQELAVAAAEEAMVQQRTAPQRLWPPATALAPPCA